MKAQGIAVKAVVHNKAGDYLILRRREDDPHQAHTWDLPGGRIDEGENPEEALHREVQEEAGIAIDIIKPIGVHHFTRDDGQIIVMIIFYCITNDNNIVLSEEHTEYRWTSLVDAADSLEHMAYALKNI